MSFSLAEDDGNDVAEMNSFAGFPSQGLLRRCFAAWSSALAEVCSGHCYCGAVRFEVSTHPKPLMPTYCHWYASLSLLRARALSVLVPRFSVGTGYELHRAAVVVPPSLGCLCGRGIPPRMAHGSVPAPIPQSTFRSTLYVGTVRRSGSQVYWTDPLSLCVSLFGVPSASPPHG